MTDTSISRFMSQGGASTTSTGNTINAPHFDTGKPHEMFYRDALTNWTTMIRKLSKVYIKFKGVLHIICIMLYMNWNQAAQDLLTRSEKNGI